MGMRAAVGSAVGSAMALASVAVVAVVVCEVAGWRGPDVAAQVYRVAEVQHHGLALWDAGWYGGTYPANYSVVFPVVAAVIGVWVTAAAAAAGAAACFDRLVRLALGRRRLASWYFALSTVVEVAVGQLSFLTGEALGLAAVLAMARRRRPLGAALGILSALASPVAGAFLGLAVVAWALSARSSPLEGPLGPRSPLEGPLGPRSPLEGPLGPRSPLEGPLGRRSPLEGPLGRRSPLEGPLGRRWARRSAVWGSGDRILLLVVGTLPLAVVATVAVLFPGAGSQPFGGDDTACILVVCALLAGPWLPVPRLVRVAAVLYAGVTAVLYVVPTEMGGNDMRLAADVGVPLLMCYFPWRVSRSGHSAAVGAAFASRRAGRGLAACAVGALVAWGWAPAAGALSNSGVAASHRSFYLPLIAEVKSLSATPVRVEVTPTRGHWEAEWVAPSVPLARGWERQLDIGYDPIFYRSSALTAAVYQRWLIDAGVSYVALPAAPLDFAARAEASLLRSGQVTGLRLVWRSTSWQLWRVDASAGLVSGPGRVTSLDGDHVGLQIERRGPVTVKLRWSPYWSVAPGAGCLQATAGGWTELRAARAGRVVIFASMAPGARGACG
ncbi:MAG TPA: hypothetical protein VG184_08470 [Acidimicrobiales bacterium]|jgi:hypothetical protein|nr:hypothetical protein [Acidimicrobiales bacterium]